jgi:hypothetical protein
MYCIWIFTKAVVYLGLGAANFLLILFKTESIYLRHLIVLYKTNRLYLDLSDCKCFAGSATTGVMHLGNLLVLDEVCSPYLVFQLVQNLRIQ